jgi:hypothetical protein
MKKTFYQGLSGTKIIIAFLILCTAFSFHSFAQDDQVLDKEGVEALIEKLQTDVASVFEDAGVDESIAEALGKKWEERDLVGKTRKEAIELLFEDLKSVYTDEEKLKEIMDLWNTPLDNSQPDETDKPEEAPEPQDLPEPEETPTVEEETAPEASATPYVEEEDTTEGSAPRLVEVLNENIPMSELIEIGESPLSEADMTAVMKWIAVKVSANKLPFCWRQSYGRGVGNPLSSNCAAGLDKSGLLCYPKCRDNYKGVGPVCWANCPAGFTDIGAFCQKSKPYGRGAGFPWKFGDKPFSLNGARKRCQNKHGTGNCEKWGAVIYPKCRKGFHNVGCCVCSPDCPAGYKDTGTGCAKPTYGRGAGEPLACAPGKERSGLLCYPPCKSDFKGVGPVCWQSCPSQLPTNCGAGCAKSGKDCASNVFSMVSAPIMAAVNIATLGQSAAATSAAKAAQVAQTTSKLTATVNKVKGLINAAKGSVETLVGGADKLKKIQKVVKIGKKTYKVASTVGKEIDLFSRDFADNFADMTSPEIDREINQRFGKEAAYQIKREWAMRQLTLNLEANGFATAKNVLTLASVADPTGLISVANAFLHPVCKADAKFPTVTPLYNY